MPRRVTRVDDTYSRLVAWLKIVLPLAALAMLSSLFLMARGIDPNRAVDRADLDVERLVREPRLSGGTYAGVTADGSAITLSAETLQTDLNAATRLHATGLSARIETPDGQNTTLRAETGWIDRELGRLALLGGVDVSAAPGYELVTQSLSARLDRTRAEFEGGVAGTGPPGRISADHLVLRADPAHEGRYILDFTDNVMLVYQPQPED